ncbi:MAG: hypothetical protein WDZ59_03695 [Pirellulales bacterium]
MIPDVLAFRDKVAAHSTWTTKSKRDDDAKRLASILPPLSFSSDRFFVGASTITVRRGGKVSNSQAIKPWSLTEVHEALIERYWPELDRS